MCSSCFLAFCFVPAAGSVVRDLDSLYAAASSAQPLFQRCLTQLVAMCDLPSSYISMAELKGRPRAAEKAKDDYGSREMVGRRLLKRRKAANGRERNCWCTVDSIL